MATNTEEYVLKESMIDVVFIIDGHRIGANKVVLSFNSPVFKVMFSEKFSESNVKEITIEDMDFKAFEAVIKYLHFGVIDLNYFNNGRVGLYMDYKKTFELLKCVNKYQLNGLKDRIEEDLLLRRVNVSNSKVMLELSHRFGLNEIKNKLKEIIEQNLDHFIVGSIENIKQLDTFSDNYIFETFVKNYRNLQTEVSDIKRQVAYDKSVLDEYNTLKSNLYEFFYRHLTKLNYGDITLFRRKISEVTEGDNIIKWYIKDYNDIDFLDDDLIYDSDQ